MFHFYLNRKFHVCSWYSSNRKGAKKHSIFFINSFFPLLKKGPFSINITDQLISYIICWSFFNLSLSLSRSRQFYLSISLSPSSGDMYIYTRCLFFVIVSKKICLLLICPPLQFLARLPSSLSLFLFGSISVSLFMFYF